ncbi:DUF1761 domain-containing protein [Cytophagaceae bacterium ABcell3]|nr:DUF1761 domain-containing protein [Cytophagaceae bacterium ABcell3]
MTDKGKLLTINHAAVIVLTVVYQVIMMAWFMLFAEVWMELQGFSEEDLADASALPYVIAFVSALIMNYVLAWSFIRMGVKSGVDGLKTGFILGFGLVALQLVTQYSFSLKPFALALIDAGGLLLVFLVSGYVLGSWKKFR